MLDGMSRLHDHRPLQILVAYEGSGDAAAAVELTAAALPGARAMVLSLWEPPIGEEGERPAETTPQLARRATEHARSLGLEAEAGWQAVLVVPPTQTAEPRPAAVEERAGANGGLRMQVVPLEDV
jgi:hypothetical protein